MLFGVSGLLLLLLLVDLFPLILFSFIPGLLTIGDIGIYSWTPYDADSGSDRPSARLADTCFPPVHAVGTFSTGGESCLRSWPLLEVPGRNFPVQPGWWGRLPSWSVLCSDDDPDEEVEQHSWWRHWGNTAAPLEPRHSRRGPLPIWEEEACCTPPCGPVPQDGWDMPTNEVVPAVTYTPGECPLTWLH